MILKEKFKGLKLKVSNFKEGAVLGTISAVALPFVITHADDTITTSMTTSMTQVKTDALSAISAVAPIAIGIMGAFLVWRYGIRFFKGISK